MAHKQSSGQVSVLIASLALIVAVFAQCAAAQTAVPEMTWTASMLGEGVPEQVAPNYTVFNLDNDGEAAYTQTLFRLKEGATVAPWPQLRTACGGAYTIPVPMEAFACWIPFWAPYHA